MVHMWIVTVGFVIILGLIGGVFIHFLSTALNKEDATTIDPLPNQQDGNK